MAGTTIGAAKAAKTNIQEWIAWLGDYGREHGERGPQDDWGTLIGGTDE